MRRWLLRRWLFSVFGAVTLIALAIALQLPTSRDVLLGIITNESFYRGRPTHYWVAALDRYGPGREQAITTLVEGGSQAVPVLLEIQEEKRAPYDWFALDPPGIDRGGAQQGSARALKAIGSEAVPALVNLLRSRRLEIRKRSVYALGALPRTPETIPALARVLEYDSEIGWEAVRALANIVGPEDIALAPALVSRLGSDSPYASSALGHIGANAVPQLIEALADKNPRTRGHAALALAHMRPKAKEALPALIRLLGQERAATERAADRRFICKYVALAIGVIGPDARTAVPELISALDDEDGWVRRAAIIALQRIGPDAHDAVPALRKSLEDSFTDTSVINSQLAAGALNKIDRAPSSKANGP